VMLVWLDDVVSLMAGQMGDGSTEPLLRKPGL